MLGLKERQYEKNEAKKDCDIGLKIKKKELPLCVIILFSLLPTKL